jgi:hypothetical protein
MVLGKCSQGIACYILIRNPATNAFSWLSASRIGAASNFSNLPREFPPTEPGESSIGHNGLEDPNAGPVNSGINGTTCSTARGVTYLGSLTPTVSNKGDLRHNETNGKAM